MNSQYFDDVYHKILNEKIEDDLRDYLLEVMEQLPANQYVYIGSYMRFSLNRSNLYRHRKLLERALNIINNQKYYPKIQAIADQLAQFTYGKIEIVPPN